MSTLQPIITNQEFRTRWVLFGLEYDNEQFKISPNATVEVRIKSDTGATAYTTWQTLTYNENRDDDWALSTLDIIISDTDTALVLSDNAIIDVRIQGVFVNKDGTDSSDAYDKTWSALYPVDTGLA